MKAAGLLLVALCGGCDGFTYRVDISSIDPSVASIRADDQTVPITDVNGHRDAQINFQFGSYQDGVDVHDDLLIEFLDGSGTVIHAGHAHPGGCSIPLPAFCPKPDDVDFEEDFFGPNLDFSNGESAGIVCGGGGKKCTGAS